MAKYSVDLNELIIEAFISGFLVSGEGYNGEYPFDYNKDTISRELHPQASEVAERLMSQLKLEDSPHA